MLSVLQGAAETRGEMTAEPSQTASRVSLAFFLVTAVAMGADVFFDWAAGSPPGHVWLESALMVGALAGTLWFARRLTLERRESRLALGEALAASERWRDEAARWREETREHLDGLGRAIDRQLEEWSLTPAEREVALLVLKGLSLKEVATVRSTSDGTTRQQANSVYRKAGLRSRAELSAFFLEDLL